MQKQHNKQSESLPDMACEKWVRLKVFLSLLLAATIGLTICAITLQISRLSSSIREPQLQTIDRMGKIGDMLSLYSHYEKKMPTTLEEMYQRYDEMIAEGKVHENHQLGYGRITTDGWENAFLFSQEGPSSWTLLSYGADRQAGGVGINADVFCTEKCFRWRRAVMNLPSFQKAYPTYAQTLKAEWPTVLTCGGIGFALTCPLFFGYYFFKTGLTQKKYIKEALKGIVCIVLFYFFLRLVGTFLFYTMPGD